MPDMGDTRTLALADELTSAAGDLAFRRSMTAVELEFGDVERVAREFDEAEAAVAKAGAPVVKRIVAQLAAEVAPLVRAGDVAALASVQPSYVAELAAALTKGVAKALVLGSRQIADAHSRQTGGRFAERKRPPSKDPKKARDYLKGRSQLAAQQVAETVRAKVTRSASMLVMKGSTVGISEEAAATLIETEVWAGAEKTLVGTALELGREGVGVGRLLALEETVDEIAEVHQSAILDDRVCDVCADQDGRSWIAADGDDITEGITCAPVEDCEGGSSRCRCVAVVIYRR